MPAVDLAPIREHIQRVARDTVFNYIGTKDPKRDAERLRAAVVHAVHMALKPMQDQNRLSNYRVDVDAGEAVRLGERDIPKDAVPGDRFGETGIIVSSDGSGRGVVFDPHAVDLDPGQVRVRVDLQIFRPLDYVVIDFKVADTAY